MSNSDNDSTPKGFSPQDLTDGRESGNWKTRYNDREAQEGINWEKKYLIIVFCCALIIPLSIIVFLNLNESWIGYDFINIKRYILAWSGGTLGGTVFATKWLVHSVAKNDWNIDRRLWRIFTPHLSAALAFIIILLINCGMIDVIKNKDFTIHKCFGIGFLVGYFSDNAIGKLTEVAQVFFGSGMSRKK
jgi:hypothetical protein